MSILNQIVSTGEQQGLSTEEIQAQLDIKKSEFKTAKTSTTQQDSGVDADENGSIMESDLESGSSVSTKQKKPDWKPVFSKSGNIVNLKDPALKTREDIYVKKVENDLMKLNSEVPEEDVEQARANQYFKLDERPTEYITSMNSRGAGVYQPIPIEQYLGKEKYEQYLGYLENGEIKPLNSDNAEYLLSLGPGSVETAQQLATEKYYRNNGVGEEIRNKVDFFGNDKEFTSEEEADKFLEKQYEFIQEKNKELVDQYDDYDKQTAVYQDQFNVIKTKMDDIENRFSEDFFGNISPDSPEDARAYQNLIAEAQVLEDKYIQEGFNDLYDSLVKTQNDNNYLVNQFRKKSKKVSGLKVSQRAAGLDYSVSARAGMALEEFFAGGAVNTLGLTGQLINRAAYVLANPNNKEQLEKLDESFDAINEYTTNYNLDLAKKREETIPQNLRIDDVQSGEIGFGTWFMEALANNSPSILTTFIPGGLYAKGALGVKSAGKISTVFSKAYRGKAMQKALQAQKAYAIMGRRTAQGIFFIGETGGKFGEIQVNAANAKEFLPRLYELRNDTTNEEIKSDINDQIEELELMQNYSFTQKAFTSYGYGVAATVAETLGSLKFIEGASKIARNIGVNQFKKEMYSVPLNFRKNIVGKTLSGFGKVAGKGISIELAEETLTQIAHNSLDILALKENKSFIDGIDKDFFANTIVTSLAIMSPKVTGNTVNLLKNEFRIKNDVDNTQKLVKELIALDNSKRGLKGNKQYRENRARRIQIIKELAIQDVMSINKLNYMTKDQIVEAADLSRRMREINKEASSLGLSGEIGSETNLAKERLDKQYKELESERESLISSKLKALIQKQKELSEIFELPSTNPDVQYHLGLSQFYQNVAMTLQPKDGEFIVVENLNELDDALSKYDTATRDKIKNGFGSKWGANTGNDIILNQTAINKAIYFSSVVNEGKYAATAALEELFHIQNKGKSIVNEDGNLIPEAEKAVGEALQMLETKKALDQISEKDYNTLLKRFERYNQNGQYDAEELLAQINNAVALGALSQEDVSSMGSLKSFINYLSRDTFGDSSWLFNLQTGKDVFEYIKNYNENIQAKTTLALPDEKETNKIVKDSVGMAQDFDQYTTGQNFKTNEEFKNSSAAVGIFNEIENNQQFDSYIKQLIRIDKNLGSLPDNVKSKAKDQIKERIQERVLKNYNPLLNGQPRSVFSYIFGAAAQRGLGGIAQKSLLDVKKDYATAPSTVSTTTSEGKTIDVADETTTVEESIDEAATIPESKLKQESPELVDQNIEDAVETAVREIAAGVYPDIDSKDFLPFIQEVLEGKLTQKFKNKFGTREQYDEFIKKLAPVLKRVMPVSFFVKLESNIKPEKRKFTEPPVRLTKQKDIDKARENEQINYLENDAQGVNLYKLKKFTDAELSSFLNPSTINPKTGKKSGLKGNRKTSVAKSTLLELGRDMIPSIFQGKVSDADLAKIGLKISRDPRTKFSEGIENEINAFMVNQMFESTEFDFATNAKNWKKLIGISLKSFENTVSQIDNSTPEGRERYKKALAKYLAPRLPKEFFRTLTGTTENLVVNEGDKTLIKENKDTISSNVLESLRDYTRQLAFKNVAEIDDWIAETEKTITFPSIDKFPNYKAMLEKEAYTYTKNKKKKEKLPDLFKNKKWKQSQEDSLKGLEEVFLVFQDIMEDAEGVAMVGALLESTSAYQGHFIRRSSPVRFFEKNYLENGFVEEHTLPASLVAKFLFIQALNGKVKTNFGVIRNNYFQGALSKASDNKLAGIGVNGKKFNYKDKTPEGWLLSDNIWARYFNANVSNNKFGIAPDQIVQSNGKSVYQEFNVNSSGYKIPSEAQKQSNQAATKNNSLLPNVIKEAKNSPNEVVLDKMKTIDEAQTEAIVKNSQGIDLNKEFNDIIASKTGIASEKVYGAAKAAVSGRKKGKFDFAGIPPSAQDFVGLLYYTLGKGKEGNKQAAWYKENLLDPFARAMVNISNDRVALTNDFKALKEVLKISPKNLKKDIPGEPFTVQDAVRVYIWTQQGMAVPDLSKTDLKELNEFVAKDENLSNFANQLITINKGDGYVKPDNSWLAGSIDTDLLKGLTTIKRAKYLEQWQNNVNTIFSEANLNKLEAAFGKGYRKALENMLQRMKTGSNRGADFDSLTGRFIDWINGSVGAIMFFNTRSAILQTISSVNFVNWSDNNMLAAAKAFANQPQYWKDVIQLMNSDFLVERRNGLKINVNEADIAQIAAESNNKAKAFISKLLKLGFLPTQIADSFAIASGGATFFRNRVKTYTKDGMTQKEAEAQAFLDFREIAEESQQSSRPDRISQQQAGPLGRIILAFANTPAQYARLIQKASSDLYNRRGDDKTNISKIIYYGAIQNIIFNALQQALFALAFGADPEDEKEQKKMIGIANGMADSLLRGLGFAGAAVATFKNVILKLAEGAEAQDAALEILDISPPISSKIGKLKSAGRTWDWNKKEIYEKGWSLDNPAYLAAGQVVSAATNIPLDRVIRKVNNVKDAADNNNEEWKRVANALGWSKWELEWADKKKQTYFKKRKSSRSSRSRTSRSKRR